MDYLITKSQSNKLFEQIQQLIDSELETIRQESEEWGLGEMEEYFELEAVSKIEIDRIVTINGIKVYVNLYKKTGSSINYFENVMSELNYKLQTKWISNIFLILENVMED